MIDIDEADKLGKAATPGPWSADEHPQRPDASSFDIRDPSGNVILDSLNSENQEVHNERDDGCCHVWDEIGRCNTLFVEYARNNWQAMVDEIRAARKEIEQLRRSIVIHTR